MAVKIRLKRLGKKKSPHYRIVVADSRAPRDGKSIDELGFYKPQQAEENIRLDAEKAKHWLSKGAQPTDTVRALFKKEGIIQ
jgi:small subunit ribosomal protein S16